MSKPKPNSDSPLQPDGLQVNCVVPSWEARYRLLVQNVKDHAFFILDTAGSICSWNAASERILGYTEFEALGRNFSMIFRPEDIQAGLPQAELRLARDNGRVEGERWHQRKDGSRFWSLESVTAMHDPQGSITGFSKILRDITDRKEGEVALQASEVRYRRLFEAAKDGILILDATSGKVIDANPFMSELLGYKHAWFLGKELWEIGLFSDIAANQAAFRQLRDNGYIRYDHLPLETQDKTKVEVEFVSNVYEADGATVIQCNIRDRSDHYRLEHELRASLEEKEVLLKEVHHRVKNNLQVISSLLHLQSRYSQDPISVEMFRESQNRVRSMALVHERLYRSQDLAQVDFTGYIESLAMHLFKSHEVDVDRIHLATDVRGVKLSIDAAIPCGLLLNELISNSLKHAFPGPQGGRIQIELLPAGAGEVLLSVSDDGVGLPAGVESLSAQTFGMQLIADLVEQLHGRLQFIRGVGTKVQITFPRAPTSPALARQHA